MLATFWHKMPQIAFDEERLNNKQAGKSTPKVPFSLFGTVKLTLCFYFQPQIRGRSHHRSRCALDDTTEAVIYH